MASDMIHEDKCDYVALLFYASWCPFSGSIRPSFDVISLIYSSVPHFAIEESSVKASTLSKYGVHGFPTIILLNSTMRLAYRGSRTLDSIVTFYRDITGIETLDETSVEKNRLVPQFGNQNSIEPENCPVSWARRSPDNLFRQETYLALATVFVVLRLLHLIFPVLVTLAKFTWGRIARNMRPGNFLEHVVAMYLKEPCMSSNLQGAMNARAWASKSLATVSIGDSSLTSSRSVSTSQ
ncbi:5'-adenylylsulfate reductase-like 6 [Eutrema salsugineum]|nr:5'-adenylylsulfate reductase-like 6 [Eutrema salsugineum]XP_024010183.1 5'-adenylylsulfate reductase-like 6 [Eutrema salsugineum]